MAAEFAFWALVALVLYVYVGYPMFLYVMSGAFSRASTSSAVGLTTPRVTILISAYNEAECIAGKLDNTLSLDYPRDALEVIVISDASEDATDEIVKSYAARGVQLLRMANRGGKTLGLNAAVARCTGEVVVFSDANALYAEDAIRRLVAPLADPAVGAVIGESTYVEARTASGQSESLYWRYETWVKSLESYRGSVVGGDGAIYAVRRALYVPMAADALSDFVNPLQVVRAGYRCVYEPRALSYEEAAADFTREYRRKVRIVNRAWRSLWAMKEMLNPFRHGSFAIKLWSHKVLRWWMLPAVMLILVLNVALLELRPLYQVTLALQIVFLALAITGALLRNSGWQPFWLRIPFFFCLVNIAAGVGILEALGGRSYTTWTTSRAGG
jgi:cellulose synthase/poly-beta-1,6-N-acetylglucosamine synthase-like glycosyltransferase